MCRMVLSDVPEKVSYILSEYKIPLPSITVPGIVGKLAKTELFRLKKHCTVNMFGLAYLIFKSTKWQHLNTQTNLILYACMVRVFLPF